MGSPPPVSSGDGAIHWLDWSFGNHAVFGIVTKALCPLTCQSLSHIEPEHWMVLAPVEDIVAATYVLAAPSKASLRFGSICFSVSSRPFCEARSRAASS